MEVKLDVRINTPEIVRAILALVGAVGRLQVQNTKEGGGNEAQDQFSGIVFN